MAKTGKTGAPASMGAAQVTGRKPAGGRPVPAPSRPTQAPARAARPPSRPTQAPSRTMTPPSRPSGFASPTSSRVDTPSVTTSRIDAAGTQEIRRMAEDALARADSQARRRQISQMRDRMLEEATRVAKPGEERVPGRALLRAFQNFLSGKGPTDPAAVMREARYAKGGMVKKAKK